MKNDVLKLIIQAEEDYQQMVKEAVHAAERYVDEQRDVQSVYVKSLDDEWALFEEETNRSLEEKLAISEQQQEAALEKRKEDLQLRQQAKAENISERLKEEVLTFYGNR